jgi:molybdenum cofactor synthesis domain-containing protein
MSSSTPEARTAAVLTVSDSSFRGERADVSGPAVAELLKEKNFTVISIQVVPDEQLEIQNAITALCGEVRLIVTTGGTGIAPRDVTPEATHAVCERLIEGIPERMRAEGVKKTPRAVLSRGVCGIRGQSLVLNLPGSPKGAAESLAAVIELLPHMLDLISGKSEHNHSAS